MTLSGDRFNLSVPMTWGSMPQPGTEAEFVARMQIWDRAERGLEVSAGLAELDAHRNKPGGQDISPAPALLAFGPGWFDFTDGSAPMRAYVTHDHAYFYWYQRNCVITRSHRLVGLMEQPGMEPGLRLNWTDTSAPLNVRPRLEGDEHHARENRRAFEWFETLKAHCAKVLDVNPVDVQGPARRQPILMATTRDPAFGDGWAFGRRSGTLEFVTSRGGHQEVAPAEIVGWKPSDGRLLVQANGGSDLYYVPASPEWAEYADAKWSRSSPTSTPDWAGGR